MSWVVALRAAAFAVALTTACGAVAEDNELPGVTPPPQPEALVLVYTVVADHPSLDRPVCAFRVVGSWRNAPGPWQLQARLIGSVGYDRVVGPPFGAAFRPPQPDGEVDVIVTDVAGFLNFGQRWTVILRAVESGDVIWQAQTTFLVDLPCPP